SGLSQPCKGVYERNMTCWQVYQLPGMDSRGLYGPGAGPIGDDPTDPRLPHALGPTPSLEAFASSLGEGAATSDLARLLFAPALDALPRLVGGDG
ncbi:MAG: hypothetical protein ACRDI3_07480, partial [Actinomycetota bacterium]